MFLKLIVSSENMTSINVLIPILLWHSIAVAASGQLTENMSCSRPNIVRHYPLSDAKHTLYLTLESSASQTDLSGHNTNNSLTRGACSLTLIGCDECRLTVIVTVDSWCPLECWNDSQSLVAGEGNAEEHGYKPSSENKQSKMCGYIQLFEPAYRNVSLVSHINCNGYRYKSVSSRLNIDASSTIYNRSSPDPSLKVEITVEKQVQNFEGSHYGVAQAGSFASPYFPHPYARRGEKYEYSITNTDVGGTIILSFTDWDISQNTRILFYETKNKSRHLVSVHYGYYFRPVIHTSGSRLFVVFEPDISSTPAVLQSRDTGYHGFRAEYSFLTAGNDAAYDTETDCGGHIRYVTGGDIKYSATHWTSGRIHDCVWVVHKSSAFQHLQINIWNMSFSEHGDVSVSFRKGLTSLSPLVHKVVSTNMTSTSTSEPAIILHNDLGIYVRLRGTVHQHSSFFLTFVSYNDPLNGTAEHQCWKVNSFFCPNIRTSSGICIDRAFLCDGYEHCPGGEDESSICNYANIESSRPEVVVNATPLCNQGEFTCIAGDRCVSRDVLCDRALDCPDGSDEYYCDTASQSGSIRWSLIIPVCFGIFCVFILLGVIVIRVRKQPKFYIDPNRHARRCRRVPLVQRVVRCHTPFGGTSSYSSGASSMGLLSCNTLSSNGSCGDHRLPGSPTGYSIPSPTFELSISPATLSASPCPSSVSRDTNPYFNFERIQTTAT